MSCTDPQLQPGAGAEDFSAGRGNRTGGRGAGGDTILLADDHDGVRLMLAEILEQAGYAVVQASDGDEALALFDAGPDAFAALVLDVVMPRLGGDQVYRAVRASRPQLGVVFVSAFGGDVVADEVASDRAATFIEKPFADEQLPPALDVVRTGRAATLTA